MAFNVLSGLIVLHLLAQVAQAQLQAPEHFANINNNNSVLNITASAREARRSNALVDSCLTNAGTTGTCMTRFKCMRQSGTVNGYCGTYGVCCETNMQCGLTSRLKRTIIKNPAVLTNDVCQYTIEAYSTNVRQLRIDFEQFELQQPTIDAVDSTLVDCTDYFMAGKFKLCGENSGQHIYLPFNVGAGIETVTLEFNIPSHWAQTNWRLIVTQLEAPVTSKRKMSTLGAFGVPSNNLQDLRTIFASHHADYDLLAPVGCDQYYTALTGNIKSFNYKVGQNTVYMPELHYTICVQASQGASMIEYSFTQFAMATQSLTAAPAYDESCHASIHTEGRIEDYLMIPQSILSQNGMLSEYQPTYYCGVNNNMIVYAYPPFIMHFSSDERLYDATLETGFSLTYRLRSSIL